MQDEVSYFLEQSNWIEREYSERSMKDAEKAWTWIDKQKRDIKVSDVLRVHNYLLKNINPRIAGKFRECDVWIGGDCKRFISSNLLKCEVANFCKDFNKLSCMRGAVGLKELVKSNHIMFERIHPFEDGNGRVGRIFYNLLRLRVGLPVDVIRGWAKNETEFHPQQKAYYYWFR